MVRALSVIMAVVVFIVLVTGVSFARQAGRNNVVVTGWHCLNQSAAYSADRQQTGRGWYCPRTGAWTNVRQNYGLMHMYGGRGAGWMNRSQSSTGAR